MLSSIYRDESPLFYVLHDRNEEALKVIEEMYLETYVQEEYEEKIKYSEELL